VPPPRDALNAWGRLGPREEHWQAVGWSVGASLVVMAIVFVVYYGITVSLAAVFDLDPTGLSFLTYILVMAPLLTLGSWVLARHAGQGRRELGLVASPPGKLLAWGSAGGLLGVASNYGLFMLLYLVVWLVSGRHLTSPDGEVIRSLGRFYQVIAIVATGIFAPLCEELFFRGALYSAMRKSLSRNRALILNALVFALLHLKWQGLPSLFALGLIFAYLYDETESIFPSIIAHAINNIVVLSVIYLT
jgi:membrane protease YdiL (CAAX protease family)